MMEPEEVVQRALGRIRQQVALADDLPVDSQVGSLEAIRRIAREALRDLRRGVARHG